MNFLHAGQCVHTGTLTNNQVEVVSWSSFNAELEDAKVHLLIY